MPRTLLWYTVVKEVATMLKADLVGGNYSLHLFSYLDTCPVLMENLNLQKSEKIVEKYKITAWLNGDDIDNYAWDAYNIAVKVLCKKKKGKRRIEYVE